MFSVRFMEDKQVNCVTWDRSTTRLMETPDTTETNYLTHEDPHLKDGESLDEVLPINFDLSYKSSKRESRRFSLPVIDNVSGSVHRLAANTKSKSPRVAGQTNSYSDPFKGSGRIQHPERRSTSMPEFYGLSELRAKHEKLRRQQSARNPSEDLKQKLPSLSAGKANNQNHGDLLTNMDNPLRRKIYLPRLDPNQRTPCLTRNRKTEVSNLRYSKDSHHKL